MDESVDLSNLPTPFTNTDYEFGIGVEDFGFWDYDPNRPNQEYQLYCQERKRFGLVAQDGDDLSGNPARKQISLLVQKDTLSKMWVLRRILMQMGPVDAMEFLVDKLKQSKSNEDFFRAMNK